MASSFVLAVVPSGVPSPSMEGLGPIQRGLVVEPS
jgi:hypothetical protein